MTPTKQRLFILSLPQQRVDHQSSLKMLRTRTPTWLSLPSATKSHSLRLHLLSSRTTRRRVTSRCLRSQNWHTWRSCFSKRTPTSGKSSRTSRTCTATANSRFASSLDTWQALRRWTSSNRRRKWTERTRRLWSTGASRCSPPKWMRRKSSGLFQSPSLTKQSCKKSWTKRACITWTSCSCLSAKRSWNE